MRTRIIGAVVYSIRWLTFRTNESHIEEYSGLAQPLLLHSKWTSILFVTFFNAFLIGIKPINVRSTDCTVPRFNSCTSCKLKLNVNKVITKYFPMSSTCLTILVELHWRHSSLQYKSSQLLYHPNKVWRGRGRWWYSRGRWRPCLLFESGLTRPCSLWIFLAFPHALSRTLSYSFNAWTFDFNSLCNTDTKTRWRDKGFQQHVGYKLTLFVDARQFETADSWGHQQGSHTLCSLDYRHQLATCSYQYSKRFLWSSLRLF